MSEDSITLCVICKKNFGSLKMLEHIASHLSYAPHYCVDCKFKSAHVQALIEHEVSTGHSIRQNESNRYMEKICSIVYKDCLIATKDGYDAVFKPTASTKSPVASDTHNPPIAISKTGVRPRKNSSDCESDSDGEVQLLPQPGQSSLKNSGTKERKRASSTPKEAPRSKVVAQADSSNEISNSGQDVEEDSSLTANQIAELDRQINRGQLSRKCSQCKEEVTNNYKCHKEHVLRSHRSMQTNEDRDTFISRFIRLCFPGAIAVTDQQCGICGVEVKNLGGRKTHVNKEHLIWYLKCPVKGCIYTALCESTITTHLKGAHKLSVDELETDEKASYSSDRNAFNAKLRPYLSRCFPYSVSNKGSDRLEKEALAEFQREMNIKSPSVKDSPEFIGSRHATSVEFVGVRARRSNDSSRRPSFEDIERPVNIHSVKPLKDFGNSVAANVNQFRDSPSENYRAEIPIRGGDKSKIDRSKTPQSSFSSMYSDRNNGYDGATTSSRQLGAPRHNAYRGLISPIRTSTKRLSPNGSIVSVERPQSQHFGSGQGYRRFGGRQANYGHQHDSTKRGSPQRKVRSRSSNREPKTTSSNRILAEWTPIQNCRAQQYGPASPGFQNTGYGKQPSPIISQHFSVLPPTFFNHPNVATYGNLLRPSPGMRNMETNLEKGQGSENYQERIGNGCSVKREKE